MKYNYILVTLTLFLSLNVLAYQPKTEIVEQFDDLKMVAFIEQKDIDNNPEWNPLKNAPPLTVQQATQAIKSVNSNNKILEIEIRTFKKYDNKWHYLIKTSSSVMNSKYEIYVVLMNGKVIPAIIEPQAYK